MNLLKKILDLYISFYSWLQSKEVPSVEKLLFVAASIFAVVLNKRQIYYLFRPFLYENRFTPFLLWMYPNEISLVKSYLSDSTNTPTVLDIGANTGQWARTFRFYFPKATIYSFEPNQFVFELLNKNANKESGWNIFPYGIGVRNKQLPFYVLEGAAEGGSYIKPETHSGFKTILTEVISLDRKTVQRKRIPLDYDIVKIDVEGYEKHVLSSLKDISFSVLSIEVDLGRGVGITVAEAEYILNIKQKRSMFCVAVHRAHRYSPEGNAVFIKQNL